MTHHNNPYKPHQEMPLQTLSGDIMVLPPDSENIEEPDNDTTEEEYV